MTAPSITIGGADKSDITIAQTVEIYDYLTQRINDCRFTVITPNTYRPEVDKEVIITLSGTRIFAGYIDHWYVSRLNDDRIKYDVDCQDYTVLFYHDLVVADYEDKTCKFIIEDIVTNYMPGYGINTDNVATGPTLDKIQFNYKTPGECLRKICQYTNYDWYVDYNKNLYFFDAQSNLAPFEVDDNSAVSDLNVERNLNTVKNRVFVRGGTYLSDSYTQPELGDGTKTDFVLEHKAHSLVVTVGGVGQDVGAGYPHESELGVTYDCLNYFQEKFVRFDTAPGDGVAVNFTYKYDVPVLIRRQSLGSIEALKDLGDIDGIRSHIIVDKNIKDKEEARTRADAFLTQNANTPYIGSYATKTAGVRSGQFQRINSTLLDVDKEMVITEVVTSIVPGGKHNYQVSLEGRLFGLVELFKELLDKSDTLRDTEDEILDKIQVLVEEIGITDAFSITQHAGGVYNYDESDSKYGLSQYG